LVAAARGGDRDAFSALADRYHARLVRYLTYRTGAADAARDLTQETFLEALRSLDRLASDRSFAAWLYGIAQNRLRMAARRRRLRQAVSLDWLPAAVAAAVPALRQADAIEASNERDMLRRVLGELSQPLREALLLHSLDGFSTAEVAQILGVSRSAAERRLSRAKEQFRERYQALSSEDQEDGAQTRLPSRVR
jgi:RNA polymerase sigma-70 factor (ECF subfamily)